MRGVNLLFQSRDEYGGNGGDGGGDGEPRRHVLVRVASVACGDYDFAARHDLPFLRTRDVTVVVDDERLARVGARVVAARLIDVIVQRFPFCKGDGVGMQHFATHRDGVGMLRYEELIAIAEDEVVAAARMLNGSAEVDGYVIRVARVERINGDGVRG